MVYNANAKFYTNIFKNNGTIIEERENLYKITKQNIEKLSILQSRLLYNTNLELHGKKVSMHSLNILFDHVIKLNEFYLNNIN
jgi:hypothetical protein